MRKLRKLWYRPRHLDSASKQEYRSWRESEAEWAAFVAEASKNGWALA